MSEESVTNETKPGAGRRLIFILILAAVAAAAFFAVNWSNRDLEPTAVAGDAASTGTPRPSRTPTVSSSAPLPVQVTNTPRPGQSSDEADEVEGEEGEGTADAPPRETLTPPPGALIQVTMTSQIGVLLDEIPVDMRDRVVEYVLEQPESFWRERAERQMEMTLYRLTFRNFFYDDKGQLPLTPKPLWNFEFDPAGPSRQNIQRHDLVVLNYTFSTVILTDENSPAEAEPALAVAGGRWQEPFTLPIDPELLLQRTGNACINEGGFPPNSVDSENAWQFYDQTCFAESGGALGCHRLRLANESCYQALDLYVGLIQTYMNFERLEWDDQLADSVRVGDVNSADTPDIAVVEQDLSNYRVIYRYFPADSCGVVEACVAAPGWRRLLQFDATIHNQGAEALHIGPVTSEDPEHNLFQYNSCHDHFHFSNYGEFLLGGDEANASKQAFCVESTGRLSNNEWSPLTHDYSCRFQGVQAGWVDEYAAGLDCQWIDVTDVFPATTLTETIEAASALTLTEPVTLPLTFTSNNDAFLCEGTPVLDENGERLWEPSGLETADGRSIDRPQCEFIPDWDANNSGTQNVSVAPQGSFVTESCRRNHIGPRRNCGFAPLWDVGRDVNFACTPGETVTLSCSIEQEAAPQVLRVCDVSKNLGVGVACAFEEALFNRTITSAGTEVSFTCPLPRDASEPGGFFSFYSAPVFPEDETAAISCTAP